MAPSGDSKWERDVGGYLSDRMQSLITQLERKPLFGFEMHRGAHRVSMLGCRHQRLEREINSCSGVSAGDHVWTNDGAEVSVITSVHRRNPLLVHPNKGGEAFGASTGTRRGR
jgi:hypothetical protein